MNPENQKASGGSSIGESGSDHLDADMFELAPVSLWLEDYSRLKALFDGWRAEGVTELRDYLREDIRRVKAGSKQWPAAPTTRCSKPSASITPGWTTSDTATKRRRRGA